MTCSCADDDLAFVAGPPPSTNPPPLDQLSELLADARSDWPAAGRPDASGSPIYSRTAEAGMQEEFAACMSMAASPRAGRSS
jgi:hypothetical protein